MKIHATTKTLNRKINRVCSELRFKTPTVLISRDESCLVHFWKSVYHDACDSYSLWCLGYIYIYIFVSNHQNTDVFPSMVKTTKAIPA